MTTQDNSPLCPMSAKCANCDNSTLYLRECARCADGHGDPEPLCEICIFQNNYYGNVCSECHGYLEENPIAEKIVLPKENHIFGWPLNMYAPKLDVNTDCTIVEETLFLMLCYLI